MVEDLLIHQMQSLIPFQGREIGMMEPTMPIFVQLKEIFLAILFLKDDILNRTVNTERIKYYAMGVLGYPKSSLA